MVRHPPSFTLTDTSFPGRTPFLAITAMKLRAIPQRLGTSAVSVVGIAGVVAVLVSVRAMATGFHKTVANSGRADRAIVLRGGSQAEINSSITRDNMQIGRASCRERVCHYV